MGDEEIGKIRKEKFDPLNPLDASRVERILNNEGEYGISDKIESPQQKSVQGAKEHITDPGIPILIPTEFTIVTNYFNSLLPNVESIVGKLEKKPSKFELALNDKLYEIGTALLDRWSQDIVTMKKKDEELAAKEYTDREYDQYRKRIEKLLQQIHSEGNTEKDTQVFELIAMFLIGTGLTSVTLHALPIAGPDFASLSTIQQIQHVIMNIVPTDTFAAELGLIGALFSASTLYRTTWMTITENQGQHDQKKKNATFAKNYAKDIEKLVDSKKLDHFVLSICMKKEKTDKPISEERIAQLIAMVKLVHLVSAIAVIYWIETKHMTSEEIGDLINGKMQLPKNDIRLPLLKKIQEQLAKIPPGDKEKVLGGLFEYIDSHPKVDELIEPSNVFENLNSFITGTVRG